jgi:phospholipase C
MNTDRREFLKKASLFTGGIGLWGALPEVIQKALAIHPEKGSTFHDAEHVVFLMQENRSFDHAFGALQGVRGFNDPRIINHPDGLPFWLQKDKDGKIFKPFHLDIKNTKATWMKSIPHSWEDQVDARNNGLYDGWIEAKRPGSKAYSHIPMTMGYYTREDIPFYYSLADSFTICDQHFCSSLTGTTTNRMFFWTGKSKDTESNFSVVRNSEATYGKEVDWTTYPERLEANGISWKVYQNELSIPSGLEGEDESLLANFTDNNLEWFKKYHVRFSKSHYPYLQKEKEHLSEEIIDLEMKLDAHLDEDLEEKMLSLKSKLKLVNDSIKAYDPSKFQNLPAKEQNLHQKAFTINDGDENFHETEWMEYEKNGEVFKTKIPRGDILHQFRNDVKHGKLPTVSWLVAPQKFSDHPSAPWFGAWYVSEVMNILTENPEIWKKTIFILNYDENDGYFDHIPPYVPPNPEDKSEGIISSGLNAQDEYVSIRQELAKPGLKPENARQSPIGLGYRVPLIVASPWTKGGWVNSEVFDLTSCLMFLEKFLKIKTGKEIIETNISSWRRSICGDLTSVFRPYLGEEIKFPEKVDHQEFMSMIHQASFKDLPNNHSPLNPMELNEISKIGLQSKVLPKQEAGIRNSSAIHYEFYIHGEIEAISNRISLEFLNSKDFFGEKTNGVPVQVYCPKPFTFNGKTFPMRVWNFGIEAGKSLKYSWDINYFENQIYQLDAYGPNGFFRSFKGSSEDPNINFKIRYQITNRTPQLVLDFENFAEVDFNLILQDAAYGREKTSIHLLSKSKEQVLLDCGKTYGWYDFSLSFGEHFERKFAGRIETGKSSKTDPQMGFLENRTNNSLT